MKKNNEESNCFFYSLLVILGLLFIILIFFGVVDSQQRQLKQYEVQKEVKKPLYIMYKEENGCPQCGSDLEAEYSFATKNGEKNCSNLKCDYHEEIEEWERER